MSTQPPGTISIAATFTIDPIVPALRFMLEQAGVPLEVRLAPYHQVFQELLSEQSLLIKGTQGINLVLIRLEDFIRDEKNDVAARSIIERTAQELGEAFGAFAKRSKIPSIVSILPPNPSSSRLYSDVVRAGEQLIERVRSLPGLIPLSGAEIERLASGDLYDAISDDLAHIPYSRDYFSALALAVARKSHAALVPPQKVLVLDCDNTLWQGVVGEDGVDGIKITEACKALQRFAIKAHSEGILICLASKNSESDVLDVFKHRPDMLLTLEHVVAHRINWDPKPQSVTNLAKDLNLGLDSFVFLDDNPVECDLMRTQLPHVVTLQVPSDDQMEEFVSNLWAFDKIAVTEEDKRRTQLYKEDAARQAFEASATNVGDFIASLDVRVEIQAPAGQEWPRLAQLTQRTNQFNFTTRRRTEPELRALDKSGTIVRSVRVSDRFGDYGLVGLVVAGAETDRLKVDTFLLSCRVLGRGVEHTILRELGSIAHTRKLPLVSLAVIPTSRNEPARAFIDSVAAQFRGPENIYLIPTKEATQITHRPGFDPDAVIEASRQTGGKKPATTSVVARSKRYQRLARRIADRRGCYESHHLRCGAST